MCLKPCQVNNIPGALHLKLTSQTQTLHTLRLVNPKKVSKSGKIIILQFLFFVSWAKYASDLLIA
jgi:hypothetical protein